MQCKASGEFFMKTKLSYKLSLTCKLYVMISDRHPVQCTGYVHIVQSGFLYSPRHFPSFLLKEAKHHCMYSWWLVTCSTEKWSQLMEK